MKQPITKLVDWLMPWRAVIADLSVRLASAERDNSNLRGQVAQLLATNHGNAAAHRRDQIAAHYQNLRAQAAETELAGRRVPGEPAEAARDARSFRPMSLNSVIPAATFCGFDVGALNELRSFLGTRVGKMPEVISARDMRHFLVHGSFPKPNPSP